MGFTRKALLISTAGLSGLVFKDDSQEKAGAKAARKQARPKAQRTTSRAAKNPMGRSAAKAPAAPRAKAARRRTAQKAGGSKGAPMMGAGNGTAHELERIVELHRGGSLTDGEFAAAKAKILGTEMLSQPAAESAPKFAAVEANVAAARHLADGVAGEPDEEPSIRITKNEMDGRAHDGESRGHAMEEPR